jgi:DNA recombination protein RmuC
MQHRVGQGSRPAAQHQAENLSKLHERLAVIDAAQKNLKDLTGEIVGLRDVLANKQTRGAYGQGAWRRSSGTDCRRGLRVPADALEPHPADCLVRLPGDPRGLVVDAKFPLEAFTLFREAAGDEARGKAMARVRSDVLVHVKDIAEKYFIPGETQDLALMFVPAESVYADLAEHFDDVVQRAHRSRVVIVSPSLLALAIQVMQSLVRDARIREEARVIQVEVGRLLEDIARLGERVTKLDAHFRQAQEDVAGIRTSTEKITKRGQRIEALEFEDGDAAKAESLRLQGPTLRAVE